MSRQIDAGQSPPFDQKIHLFFRQIIRLSVLNALIMPPSTRGAYSWTPSLRIDDLMVFQTVFLSMSHQMDTGE
jgi:hypothetical protein